jgi:hypothetical protein
MLDAAPLRRELAQTRLSDAKIALRVGVSPRRVYAVRRAARVSEPVAEAFLYGVFGDSTALSWLWPDADPTSTQVRSLRRCESCGAEPQEPALRCGFCLAEERLG